MHPLFTLVAGLAVGVVGVRLAKSANTRIGLHPTVVRGGKMVRTGFNQARNRARGAAVSGLKTIERTSGALGRKLDETSSEPMPEAHGRQDRAGAAEADDGREAS